MIEWETIQEQKGNINYKNMKTKNYNTGMKLTTLMIVVLISTVSFAATKENPAPSKNAEPRKEVVVNEKAELKPEALTGTLQDWMNNGSYWQSDNSVEISNSEISNELSKWMSSGSYWSEPVKETKKSNIASTLKTYITSGSYWSSEK